MYTVKFHKQAAKFIESRSSNEKKLIKKKFEALKLNPYPSNPAIGLKKMQGTDTFRLRIGKYRFVYRVLDDELLVFVEKAGNRGDIYDRV